MRACIDEAELVRFHAEELPPSEKAAIQAHFSECGECLTRDQRFVAMHETWVTALRLAGLPPAERRSDPSSSPAQTGAPVPGYVIEAEIGRGGQGVVFRAVQQSTRRMVALKVLREGAAAGEAARRRFEREIELAAGLRHPGIVAIHDSGSTPDGRSYCAMEYIDGVAMDQWIAGSLPPVLIAPQGAARADESAVAHRRPDLRQLLTLFSRVCDAVNYAHQRGVIHRDLKPSNILVDAAGVPHILDFGLARHADGGDRSLMTISGHVAGTLPYLSPEQARGLPDSVDVRSDVYALGVLLYRVLTGSFPYPVDGDTVSVLRHIAETPPKPPAYARPRASPGASAAATGPKRRVRATLLRLVPWVRALANRSISHTAGERQALDPDLATIVLKALEKDRERRYQTAGDLGGDVGRYLAGEPIEARRDSPWYVFRKTLKRHRAALSVAAAFVLLTAASAVALSIMYARQTRLLHESERRFEQVRALARSFIFEFDPRIRRLPGSAEARKLIVAKGLAYLDLLARDAPPDPLLLREIAAAYMTLGDIQGDVTSSNIGQPADAVDSYRKALAVLETAAAQSPPDPQTMHANVLARLRLADALFGQREMDAARRHYEAAFHHSEELLDRDPASHEFADTHADALERLGNFAAAAGDLAQAESYYARAESAAQAALAARPDDPGALRDLGVHRIKRAQLLYARGLKLEALEHYRQFATISRRLLDAAPQDLVAQRDAAIAQQWIGILLLESGQPADALEPLATALTRFERLSDADDQNADACFSVAATLTRLGEAQAGARLSETALETHRRGLAVAERMRSRWPDHPGVERHYGVALYKMFERHQARAADDAATAAERQDDRRLACEWLARCRDWFVELQRNGRLAVDDAGAPAEITREFEQYCTDAASSGQAPASPSAD